MKIGYVQKTSFIDYPGKISAIVFCQGCNFRCPYCHNPELVDPDRYCDNLLMEDVYAYLEKRKGKLDGIVITGGEPTLQADLIPFIQRVKSLGYLVKLDTNGSRPKVIQEALQKGILDYIAMDIKAPFEKYSRVTGLLVNITQIRKSIALIKDSGIPYEFRTTLVRALLETDDVFRIGRIIEGASLYVLQKFVPSKHVDRAYVRRSSFADDDLASLVSGLNPLVARCVMR
jgi:pyruvate formate lyase activating enzyme